MTWHRRNLSVVTLALLAGMAGACAPGGSSDCTSTSTASCSGTFVCENSGIHGSCNKATQVCVVRPGGVGCVDIPGASEQSCPSLKAAGDAAGCMTPFKPVCDGSSNDGITVMC